MPYTTISEGRNKLGQFVKGYKPPDGFNIGKIPWNKGRTGVYLNKTLKKMGESNIGRTPWNKNLTRETDERIRKYANTRIKSGLSKGENNPRFIDGKSKERHPYSWIVWDKIRRQVRKRDNYICQECGKTTEENGKELCVHHNTPFRIKKYHNITNLISLCMSCHNKIEVRNQKYALSY